MKTILLLLLSIRVLPVFGQTDSLQEIITKDNIYCLYQVEKMFIDPIRTAAREVNGPVNFIEIINGRITIVSRSPRSEYVQTASIDTVYMKNAEGKEVMYIEALSDGTNTTKISYIFDISLKDENTVLVHSRRKRTQENYYFECHVASEEEKALIRKYFEENSPKY